VTLSSASGVDSARTTQYTFACGMISAFVWKQRSTASGQLTSSAAQRMPIAAAAVQASTNARPTAARLPFALAVAIWSIATTAIAMKEMKKMLRGGGVGLGWMGGRAMAVPMLCCAE